MKNNYHLICFVLMAAAVWLGSPAHGEGCEDSLLATNIVDKILAERGLGPPVAAAALSNLADAPPDLPDMKTFSAQEARAHYRELVRSQSELLRSVLDERIAAVDASKFESILDKISGFFVTLNQIFFERKPLIDVIRKALLSQGSVLILGPGGTAKSDIADRLGENIVTESGETSFFTLPLTQDTTASETQGGMIMEKAEAGVMLRNWEEGVLGSYIVFLDEFFDGRLKFLRSFLKAFNERKYTQGRHVFTGKTKVFIAASNKYLNQIYEMFGNNDPQALIDRFQFVYYAPGVLQDTASILGLALNERPDLGKLKFSDLDSLYDFSKTVPISKLNVLRTHFIFRSMRRRLQKEEALALALYLQALNRRERVQPPYKSTRVFSPRSLAQAFRLTKVQALLRFASEKGPSMIEVAPKDVDDLLASYLVMQGPSQDQLEAANSSSDLDHYEKSQLQTLKIEQTAMQAVLDELHTAEEDVHGRVAKVFEAIDSAKDASSLESAQMELIHLVQILNWRLAELHQAEKIEASQIAALEGLKQLQNHNLAKALLQ